MSADNKRNVGKYTFILRKEIGKCPCCDENVYDNQLYVKEDKATYHYSCYNFKKASEDSAD